MPLVDLSERTLQQQGFLDRRLGPILEVRLLRLGLPEPAWWWCHVALARTPAGTRFSPTPVAGDGTSIEMQEAERRGIGEALERYSALSADPVTRRGAARELDSFTFPRCAPDENCPASFRSIDPDVELTFVQVQRLCDGQQVEIPAGYVHLNYWPPSGEPLVAFPISTGLAFRRSMVEALWYGLCEVAERDALMLTWWLQSSVPEIAAPLADAPPTLAARLTRLRRAGLSARFFDITTDFRVPIVFCLLSGASYPRVTVGAACRVDPVGALCKSLDEAIAGRVFVQESAKSRLVHDSAQSVRRLEDHLLYYADGRRLRGFAFLTKNSDSVNLKDFVAREWWTMPSTMTDLAALAGRLLAAEGLTVLWADVTAPEVAELGHVIKVVVPEMVPLSPDHSARWLATPRLLATGKARGAREGAFNPYPHPFG